MEVLSRLEPMLLSLLRVMSGLLLLQHGTTKLLGIPATKATGIAVSTMPGAAGVIELVVGILLVIGLFTRLSAFIASGLTAVAYFLVHAGQNFFPIINGGELAALYCFVFLFLAAAGGGPISVDSMIRQKN